MVKMRYLLDTNILSEEVKPQPNLHVMQKLQEHRHELATATVVWHELWFGCYRLPESRKRQHIEHYLKRSFSRISPSCHILRRRLNGMRQSEPDSLVSGNLLHLPMGKSLRLRRWRHVATNMSLLRSL